MENYNDNSKIQNILIFRFIDKINSLIEKPINNFKNSPNKKTFKILDIGSSHGKNSVLFLDSILTNAQIKNKDAIEIYHCDQEINNFTELFFEVNKNENSYKNKWDIFSFAIGNSFLNQLMPSGSCDFIFSFNTFHWCNSKDGMFECKDGMLNIKDSSRRPGTVEYNKKRLSSIFTNRCEELKDNGVFVCNFLYYDPENEITSIGEQTFKNVKSVIRQMANENILSHEEVDNMVLPVTYYKQDEIDHAVELVESKGMKLLDTQIIHQAWNKDEVSKETFIGSIMAFSSYSIKSAIKGDSEKVNSTYKEIYKRLTKEYKEKPELFVFSLTFIHLIFRK
ncbi:hypothetical protein DICPUDRAFT_82327 [Dictyostelium purpureum]|uniref:Methyltransferase type 11 domain-containing protein n=1 Tax=Dictyostelium purpureum TaxID=5786 RepID=F0ZW73_DICPU|nr:uncharacterized protein DICPUDRAFT_82327 [Dictyostelium purpureum]EGC31804.1 hypothetical protein DICPUDRAFT_82327 [Dictyostelium purpureum]|eukprot:XP_003291671.1 hypothetical protein DICPUDRAFT_82327 [Dictyostelium purpureum]